MYGLKNFAATTIITGAISNVDTSVIVASTTNLPTTYPYVAVLFSNTYASEVDAYLNTAAEIIFVTANPSGTTLTIQRSKEGTTAPAGGFGIGDYLVAPVTAGVLNEITSALQKVEPLFNGSLQKITSGASITADGWALGGTSVMLTGASFGVYGVHLVAANDTFTSPFIPIHPNVSQARNTVSFVAEAPTGATLTCTFQYYDNAQADLSIPTNALAQDIGTDYGAVIGVPTQFVLMDENQGNTARYCKIVFTLTGTAGAGVYISNVGWNKPLPVNGFSTAVVDYDLMNNTIGDIVSTTILSLPFVTNIPMLIDTSVISSATNGRVRIGVGTQYGPTCYLSLNSFLSMSYVPTAPVSTVAVDTHLLHFGVPLDIRTIDSIVRCVFA